ncbi:MAG: N-acetylmuramoyl-L-alanine amidase [Ruminococcus sp.]|nr:N-acetylmuramoyl-L-alanine amidase [Ruminococcus sp.]
MNVRETYLTIYGRRYQRREKKSRRRKRIIMTLVSLCAIAGMVSVIPQIPLGEVLAATKTTDTADRIAVFGNMIPGMEVQDKVAATEALITENDVPVIFIDAGHGGADEGCARNGIQEKTINLAIAQLVQTQLETLGYQVVMARTGDTYISKEERVQMANSAGADIYVSIHQNAADDSGISGMEVWYDGSDISRDNKRLALLIKQQTAASTQAAERELRGDADFHVTGNTTMPCCLIETGFLSNADERGKLVDAAYQQEIAEGIVRGIAYYFHPKTMYLTFDDGPSEENTIRVLDILKERNIKATFFLVGENVRQHPEIAKRIVEEGHTIGIHSDSHDYEKIYANADAFLEDFEAAHQIVYEVTGVDAKFFRFPGGSVNAYNNTVREEIIEKMTEKGYIFYDWNASLEDAVKETTPEQLVANGVDTTLGRKTVIMLAHDVVYDTGLCLNDLLDSLPEYEMRPLDENVEPIQFARGK